MRKVYAGATMSIDGYISGTDESGFDQLFQWYGSGDVEMTTTHRATARARGRRRPDRGPRAVRIAAAGVRDVVLTHLHDDHSGSLVAFPRARSSVQDDELAFWTGRHVGAARSATRIVPGHDPLVLERHPPSRADLAGLAADCGARRGCCAAGRSGRSSSTFRAARSDRSNARCMRAAR